MLSEWAKARELTFFITCSGIFQQSWPLLRAMATMNQSIPKFRISGKWKSQSGKKVSLQSGPVPRSSRIHWTYSTWLQPFKWHLGKIKLRTGRGAMLRLPIMDKLISMRVLWVVISLQRNELHFVHANVLILSSSVVIKLSVKVSCCTGMWKATNKTNVKEI